MGFLLYMLVGWLLFWVFIQECESERGKKYLKEEFKAAPIRSYLAIQGITLLWPVILIYVLIDMLR